MEMYLTWRELAGKHEKSSVHMVKTIIVFENEKKLLEPNDCNFLYINLVEELPEEVFQFAVALPDPSYECY